MRQCIVFSMICAAGFWAGGIVGFLLTAVVYLLVAHDVKMLTRIEE